MINEIRIGNWFEHLPYWSYRNEELKSFLFQWDYSDWYNYCECCLPIQNIKPIIITHEVLERCGFSKYNTVNLWIKGDFYLHRYLLPDNEFCFKYNDFNSSSIKYLHQLQNLYFALTGEELQYTPCK